MTTPAAPPAPIPPARRARRGRWLAWLVLLAVVVGQCWQASRLFPSLDSIWEASSPVVMVDHAIHEYHGMLGAGFLRAHGTTWGYDPAFMAGYPETPVWDSSSNLAIGASLLGGESAGYRPYKLAIVAVCVLGLGALLGGGGLAGLGLGELAAAGVLAWVYFWVEQPVTFVRSGLVAFLGAGLGSALVLGWCVRVDRGPDRWWAWLALMVAAAGVFFLHVTTPVMVGPGALAGYLLVARRHGRRWQFLVALAVAATVAVNLAWLVPLWRFRGIRTLGGGFMTDDSPWYLWDYYTRPGMDAKTAQILMALGVPGLVGWWFGGRRAAASSFGGSIAALVLLAGFGSLWGPTRAMEPLRFRLIACLLLALPAGSTLVLGPRWLAGRLGGGRAAWVAVGASVLVVAGAWGWGDRAYLPQYVRALGRRYPLVVGVPPEARPLVGWLRRDTDPSARVMIEDQLRVLQDVPAESTHWTPLLPALLAPDERQFVGGLYHTAFIRHHQYAAFGHAQLGGRPIVEWTPAEVDRFLATYNVGWVACWSPLARAVFDRLPGATRVATLPIPATPGFPRLTSAAERAALVRLVGAHAARELLAEGGTAYAAYRLDRPHSYFLRGRGRLVSAGPNRVELADVEPDDSGVAVLSLHWLDTWQAEPAATLKPEPAPPDPVPLVRIEAKGPIPRLVLRNGYGW